MAWYAKEFPGAADLRNQLCLINTVEEGIVLLDGTIAQLKHNFYKLPA
jgi:tRNA-dihydrouridine synthase B